MRPWTSIALFCLLLAYFGLWALIKPPYQSPDEFAHSRKAWSIPASPWLTPSRDIEVFKRFSNPLSEVAYLHRVPFHANRKFDKEFIAELKALPWGPRDTWERETLVSTAYSYPPLYYASVFLLGQSSTEMLSLSPYQSHYAYRLASALLASILWLMVFHRFGRFERHRLLIFTLLVLNPMVGFISSAVNPDAFIFPLLTLTILFSYDSLVEGRNLRLALAVLLLSCFTKPAGILAIPSLAIISCLMLVMRKNRGESTAALAKSATILVGASAIVSFGAFYLWSPPAMSARPLERTLLQYFSDLAARAPIFFESYWGRLGWVDYSAADGFFLVLLALLLSNILLCLHYSSEISKPQFAMYALLFAVIYSAGILAGEFLYLDDAGYTVQGRYFIPVSLGFSVCLLHPLVSFGYLLPLYLCSFNYVLMLATVDRYYAGDWSRVLLALPF